MSSNLVSARRRPPAGRLKRIAVAAVAVTVGAIILSGCVVIQSESALQGNVIGNTRDGHHGALREQQAAAPPCNCRGDYEQVRASRRRLRDRQRRARCSSATASRSASPRRRRSRRRRRPPTRTATPSRARSRSRRARRTRPASTAIVPPPAGTAWVGYVSDASATARRRAAAVVTLAPTFTLPAGFTGPFTWRTVVGYRPATSRASDVTLPGCRSRASRRRRFRTVCVDFPDAGHDLTARRTPCRSAISSITAPATPTIAAGSTVALSFTGLFTGGNPTGAVFAVAASTTIPGVTPTVTPTFAPAANSSNPLSVSLTIPRSTPAGTYDVTVVRDRRGPHPLGHGPHHREGSAAKSTASATAGVGEAHARRSRRRR